ncbi:MAG: DUF2721 domain-containing protein [Calditrichaeota bacterium]|nr:MAG: DUF2721 domain-containing protein [Calditrichota bacterium]
MEITLTTPALLFSTISLLLLAYTNRFLALAALIRQLHNKYQTSPSAEMMSQILNLKKRVVLIKNMQAIGIFSLFFCVLCMFLLFAGLLLPGKITFGLSLVFMMASLILSLQEIRISVDALNLQLSDRLSQINK